MTDGLTGFTRYWGTKKVQMYGHLSIAASSVVVMVLWAPLTADDDDADENRVRAYILFLFYLLFYYAVNCECGRALAMCHLPNEVPAPPVPILSTACVHQLLTSTHQYTHQLMNQLTNQLTNQPIN